MTSRPVYLIPRLGLLDPPGLLQTLVLVPQKEAELLVVYLAISVGVSALQQLHCILVVDAELLKRLAELAYVNCPAAIPE